MLQKFFVFLRKYLPWLVLADILVALLVSECSHLPPNQEMAQIGPIPTGQSTNTQRHRWWTDKFPVVAHGERSKPLPNNRKRCVFHSPSSMFLAHPLSGEH